MLSDTASIPENTAPTSSLQPAYKQALIIGYLLYAIISVFNLKYQISSSLSNGKTNPPFQQKVDILHSKNM